MHLDTNGIITVAVCVARACVHACVYACACVCVCRDTLPDVIGLELEFAA